MHLNLMFFQRDVFIIKIVFQMNQLTKDNVFIAFSRQGDNQNIKPQKQQQDYSQVANINNQKQEQTSAVFDQTHQITNQYSKQQISSQTHTPQKSAPIESKANNNQIQVRTSSQIRLKLILQNKRLKNNIEKLKQDVQTYRLNQIQIAAIINQSKMKIIDYKQRLKQKSKNITELTETNIRLKQQIRNKQEKINHISTYSDWQQSQIRQYKLQLQSFKKEQDQNGKPKIQQLQPNHTNNDQQSSRNQHNQQSQKSLAIDRRVENHQVLSSVNTIRSNRQDRWLSVKEMSMAQIQLMKQRQVKDQQYEQLSEINQTLNSRILDLQQVISKVRQQVSIEQSKWKQYKILSEQRERQLIQNIQESNLKFKRLSSELQQREKNLIEVSRQLSQAHEQAFKSEQQSNQNIQKLQKTIAGLQQIIERQELSMMQLKQKQQQKQTGVRKQLEELIDQLSSQEDKYIKQINQMATNNQELHSQIQIYQKKQEQNLAKIQELQTQKQENQQQIKQASTIITQKKHSQHLFEELKEQNTILLQQLKDKQELQKKLQQAQEYIQAIQYQNQISGHQINQANVQISSVNNSKQKINIHRRSTGPKTMIITSVIDSIPQDESKSNNKDLKPLVDTAESAKFNIFKLTQQNNHLKQLIISLNNQIVQLKEQRKILQQQRNQMRQQLTKISELKAEVSNLQEIYKHSVEIYQNQINSMQNSMRNSQKDISKMTKSNHKIMNTQYLFEQQQKANQQQKQIKAKDDIIITKEQQICQLKNYSERFKTQLQSVKNNFESIESQKVEWLSSSQKNQLYINEYEQQIEMLQVELKSLKQLNSQLTIKNQQLQQTIKNLRIDMILKTSQMFQSLQIQQAAIKKAQALDNRQINSYSADNKRLIKALAQINKLTEANLAFKQRQQALQLHLRQKLNSQRQLRQRLQLFIGKDELKQNKNIVIIDSFQNQTQQMKLKIQYLEAYVKHLEDDNHLKQSNHSKTIISQQKHPKQQEQPISLDKLEFIYHFLQNYPSDQFSTAKIQQLQKSLDGSGLQKLFNAIVAKIDKFITVNRDYYERILELGQASRQANQQINRQQRNYNILQKKLQKAVQLQKKLSQTQKLLEQTLLQKTKNQEELAQKKAYMRNLEERITKIEESMNEKYENDCLYALQQENQSQEGSNISQKQHSQVQVQPSDPQFIQVRSYIQISQGEKIHTNNQISNLRQSVQNFIPENNFDIQFLTKCIGHICELQTQVSNIQENIKDRLQTIKNLNKMTLLNTLQAISDTIKNNERQIKDRFEKSEFQLTALVRQLLQYQYNQNVQIQSSQNRNKIETDLVELQPYLEMNKNKQAQSKRNPVSASSLLLRNSLNQIKEDINQQKTSSIALKSQAFDEQTIVPSSNKLQEIYNRVFREPAQYALSFHNQFLTIFTSHNEQDFYQAVESLYKSLKLLEQKRQQQLTLSQKNSLEIKKILQQSLLDQKMRELYKIDQHLLQQDQENLGNSARPF